MLMDVVRNRRPRASVPAPGKDPTPTTPTIPTTLPTSHPPTATGLAHGSGTRRQTSEKDRENRDQERATEIYTEGDKREKVSYWYNTEGGRGGEREKERRELQVVLTEMARDAGPAADADAHPADAVPVVWEAVWTA